MEEGEEFIGGFAGGFLARGGSTGYGIYATTRRIIGVNVVKVGAWSKPPWPRPAPLAARNG